jgi:formylglycine-generating enzyme required for sulfatase activity
MMQSERAAVIKSEVYRKQWLEWKEALRPYREITALSAHFAFREHNEMSAGTISKFFSPLKVPSRRESYRNLFTLMAVAHWRGLIADRQAFLDCLGAWGLETSANDDYDPLVIWAQITDGIHAYEAFLKLPPKPAPVPEPPAPVTSWPQRLRTRRAAAILATALVALTALVGVGVWQVRALELRNAAGQLQLQLDATSIAVLGGLPYPERTVAPAEVFARATTMAATATAVAVIAAHPTVVALAYDGARMVYVPGGCFWAGNYGGVRSSPVFYHCLPSFWMDETKVSNAQYRQVTGQQPRSRSCIDHGWDVCAALPVENIIWAEAQAFCAARSDGGRLPTELEWEYAARGPLSTIYPWGNVFDAARLDVRGQTTSNTAPGAVDAFPEARSWAGVVGMVGGVNEWTSSISGPYPYRDDETRDDPSDTQSARVVRGASFIADMMHDDRLAAYNRGASSPGTRTYLTGFRCVRDAADEPGS